ncbi:MAG: hypothetical protein M1840_005248 [Geoglossum simile]|nr:MAG: hypothetical protein M1840_005248 [Geoglossum simile]
MNRERLEHYTKERQKYRKIIRRLKRWAYPDLQLTKYWTLSSLFRYYRRPPPPNDEELISLTQYFYPPRGLLKVFVCDFGDNRTERREIKLNEIESYYQDKPDWAAVRWIHAPLGFGLTHSSVEDLFLTDRSGRPFNSGSAAGWPYPSIETLNFRSRENIQEKRDAFLILSKLDRLEHRLNQISNDSINNGRLGEDINWRAGHHGTTADYWNLAGIDMPWQLSEGISTDNPRPRDNLSPISRNINRQVLSKHSFYKNAQLVRNPFRCFHRPDGYLLTLSAAAGVDFLDVNFSKYIDNPIDCVFDNEDASALGLMLQLFEGSGTATWHRKTVEWFLVYLITELAVTPHNIRQGCNAVSILNAYQSVVQGLKEGRYKEWKRNDSVILVREYLTCIDELTSISVALNKKIKVLEGLQQDVQKFEMEDATTEPDNPDGERAAERLQWALDILKEQRTGYQELLVDLRLSLDALFQVRSMEQNDLAIVADSQNQATLVFTGVTIVFLPLSFFTGYFGMNLRGVVNTQRTESFFWRVCGTAGFLVIILVLFYAFRQKIRNRIVGRPLLAPRMV